MLQKWSNSASIFSSEGLQLVLRLVFIICLAFAPVVVAADTPSKQSEAAVVFVVVLKSQSTGLAVASFGSGFIVAPGKVVTNQHVVAPGEVFVVIPAGSADKYEAKLVWSDPGADMALLDVSQLPGTPLQLATQAPDKGKKVYAFGFPGASVFNQQGGSKIESTLTDGILSSSYSVKNWGQNSSATMSVLQHTAEISPGNSGGPLFDDCDRVIGINTSISDTNQTSARLSFASRIDELQARLKQNSPSLGLTIVDGPCTDSKVPSAAKGPAAGDQPGEDAAEDEDVDTPPSDGLLDRFRDQPLWARAAAGGLLLGLLGIIVSLQLRGKQTKNLAPSPEDLHRQSKSPGDEVAPKPKPDTDPKAKPVFCRDQFLLNSTDGKLGFAISRRLLCERQGVAIGRSTAFVDYIINDSRVSRRHCRLLWREDDLYVEDLNSTAGTYVNNRRLDPFSPTKLEPFTDILRLGPITFTVEIDP